MSDTPLPPVDEKPVLPDMTTSMRLDLAVGDDGEVYVFYEKPFAEPISWAEYNRESSQLYFMAENGRIQGLGLKVIKQMQEKMESATRIFTLHVENGETKQIIEMPLLFQN